MRQLVAVLLLWILCAHVSCEDLDVKFDEAGRVLVSRYGEFGTICGDGWGDTEAAVTCRSLGYENGYYKSQFQSIPTIPMWFYNVSCSADAMTLSDCSFYLEPTNGLCRHIARVYCFNDFNAHTYTLSGGSQSNYGYVYVTHQNKSGVLCSQSLSSYVHATNALCHSLGYNDGALMQGNSSEIDTAYAWDLKVVYCDNLDRRLELCDGNSWSFVNLEEGSIRSTSCKNNLVKVFCFGSVRLHKSHYSHLGIVLVNMDSGISAICQNSLDNNTADVVCRELNFTNGGFALGFNPFHTNIYTYMSRMKDLSCDGNEKSLLDCNYTEIQRTPCQSGTQGVVFCRTDSESVKDFELKAEESGRVMVSRYGEFGTICSDEWGDTESDVVCKSLGYDRGYYKSRQTSRTRDIPRWLYNVSCNTGDVDFAHCSYSTETPTGSCNGDASVYCFNDFDAYNYSLSGGSQSNYGYVYGTHQNKTGVLCSNVLSLSRGTRVLCQSLGYTDGVLDQGDSTEIETSNAWNFYINYCDSQERRLEMCYNNIWSFVNLDDGSSESTSCKNNLAKVFCYTSVRFHRSYYSHLGIVLVNMDSGSSAICQDSLDNNTADVVCRELNFKNGGFALGFNPFGALFSYTYRMKDLSCDGNEKSLLDCNYTEVQSALCPSGTPGVVFCRTERELVEDFEIKVESSGRVMVSRYGEFGTICSHAWGDAQASVICRSRGYDKGYSKFLSSSADNPQWFHSVSCKTADISLSNCTFSMDSVPRFCSLDAGVYCFDNVDAYNYSLTGGSQSNYGYVYVTHQNKTGVLCSSYLYRGIKILCQNFGYRDGVLDKGNSNETETSNAWSIYIYCYDEDRRLETCQTSRWSFVNLDDTGSSSCKNNLVKVFCYRSVHLHKTFYSPIGVVLITTDSRDSAVCQDSFDKKAADVVCRELHFLGGGLVLGFNPYPTSYSYMINDLSCEGTEKSLMDCNYTETYTSNCPSRSPAVVACKNQAQEDMQVEVRGDGRVIVHFYDIYGTVCADGWTNQEASVVCRQLGSDAGNATHLERDLSMPVWLYGVSCRAGDESLQDCRYSTCCNCLQDAGVQCFNTIEDTTTPPDTTTTSSPTCGPMGDASLGEDCSNARCSSTNSACVKKQDGRHTCACTSIYVQTGPSCTLGPTSITTGTTFEYTTNLSSTTASFGYINLDQLVGMTTSFSVSSTVHPDEGLLDVTRHNTTSFALELMKPLSEAKTFVVELSATDGDFKVQQIVTISLRSRSTEVFKIFLVQGTRKDTVIADVSTGFGDQGFIYEIQTSNSTVKALFDVTSDGKVICGQDVTLEDVANNNVVAKEYSFNVHAAKDSSKKLVAELYVLIFKDVFTSTITENWKGVIMTYNLLADSKFEVRLSPLPDVLTLSNDGTSITLVDGVDYETLSDGDEIDFELELKTKDNTRQTTVSVVITITDLNDNAPEMDQQEYNFPILAGSYPGTIIGVVSGRDTDTVGTISYKLTGSFSNSFNIDKLGTLSSTVALEKKIFGDSFTINVLAFDGTDESSPAMIKINLISIVPGATNLNKTFNAIVLENQASGTYVSNVSVTNYTNYNFANPIANDMFTIDLKNGYVHTAKPLDRETDPINTDYTIQAEINSQDQCFPVVIGELHTTIGDVNDNPPRFSAQSYTGSMKEESPQGTLVTNLIDIEVFDDDVGPNGQVDFSLSGTGQQYFEVERNGNRFTIKANGSTIDGETYPFVTLTLTATDNASDSSQRLSSSVSLLINLTDVNDNSPNFTTTQATVNVQEETPPRTVMRLSATDRDYSSENNQTSYLLREGGRGYFELNEITGDLRTTQKIDRETSDEFTLVVQARDNGSPPRSAEITLTVIVEDINDNAPQFSKEVFEASVSEGMCSSTILTVTATDKDTGTSGLVTYSTSTPNFVVNPTSGELRCSFSLDYETSTSHLVSIVATDRGSPSQSSTVTVNVQVLDVNDNSPKFKTSNYTVLMTTGEWFSKKPILVVDVTDDDSGNNAEITLSLSTYTNIFTLDFNTAGVLRVKQNAPKPSKSIRYSFNIIATDGGSRTSQVPVVVDVRLTSGTSRVQLKTTDFAFSIEEGVSYSSTPIGTVTAEYDPALSVEYFLEPSDIFRIDRTTGVVTCTAVQDRETTPFHILTVRANETTSSGGDSQDLALINITVTDVNDNAPVFWKRPEELLFYVKEDVPVGHSFVQVLADDKDSGENGTVMYAIQTQTPRLHFSIDEDTGDVQVSSTLDREMFDEYDLIVKASDRGTVSMSATTTVKIHIIDVNDNPPTFRDKQYHITVNENDKDALEMLPNLVYATDADINYFGLVTYAVVASAACPLMVSDYKPASTGVNGQLHLNRALDYESTHVHQCVVVAKDMKGCESEGDCSSRLSGTATVIVNVRDVNDNPPVFQDTPYIANISREAAIGDNVSRAIRATDEDSDYQGNGVIVFFIVSNQNYFLIDRNSGMVTVATSLDDIEGDSIRLVIEARDTPQSGQQLTAQTDITIEIISKTPRPFFKKTFVIPITEEKEPKESEVFVVEAFIRRSGRELKCNATNNCTFSITENEIPGTFEIDPDTGVIRQLMKLNREKTTSSFKLKVRVVDTSTSQFRTTSVLVKVGDINDNKPFFNNSEILYTVEQTKPVGTVIGEITSIDMDEESNPAYQIIPGYDNEKIGLMSNGTLFVKMPLDLDLDTDIKIELNVTDGGSIEPSEDAVKDVNSRLRVIIHVVENINPNAPVFTKPIYEANLKAGSEKGDGVNVPGLQATDKDSDRIKYGILRNNIREILVIDPTTAKLSLQYDLDDSIPPNLTVIVSAVDDVPNPKTGTCVVRITITDPKATKCVAETLLSNLQADSDQRIMFLGLFIAMAILLIIVSILALVALYKWRTTARRERYRHNITNQPPKPGKKKKDETDGYSSLGGAGNQDADYNELHSGGRDFSAPVRNPAYVSSEQTQRTGCSPPAEPLPE